MSRFRRGPKNTHRQSLSRTTTRSEGAPHSQRISGAARQSPGSIRSQARSPKSLDAAVAATLEVDPKARGTPASGVELEREQEAVVAAAGVSEKLTTLME